MLGLLITGATKDYYNDFFERADGASIFIGMIFGIIMAANVWMVIWPQQRVILANAAGVLADQPADPGASTAGRKALLASRQNLIFSIPMLVHGGDVTLLRRGRVRGPGLAPSGRSSSSPS